MLFAAGLTLSGLSLTATAIPATALGLAKVAGGSERHVSVAGSVPAHVPDPCTIAPKALVDAALDAPSASLSPPTLEPPAKGSNPNSALAVCYWQSTKAGNTGEMDIGLWRLKADVQNGRPGPNPGGLGKSAGFSWSDKPRGGIATVWFAKGDLQVTVDVYVRVPKAPVLALARYLYKAVP